MNPEGKNELPIQVHKFRTHLKCWREKRSIDRQSVRHIVNEYNGRTERVIEGDCNLLGRCKTPTACSEGDLKQRRRDLGGSERERERVEKGLEMPAHYVWPFGGRCLIWNGILGGQLTINAIEPSMFGFDRAIF